MALSSYSDLQNAVVRWTKRYDLAEDIPDFIRLAEVRIARDLNDVRLEKTATVSTIADQSSYSIPGGISSIIRLTLNGRELDSYPVEDLGYPSIPNRLPLAYAFENNALALYPSPDTAYEVKVIYKSLDALSEANPTNFVLANFPNIYLWASLAESFLYTMEEEMAATQEARYRGAIKDANRANNFKRKTKLVTNLPVLRARY